MMNYYLICVWDGVEPELFGPFPTHIERDAKARLIREADGNEHGLFPLDIIAEELTEVEIGAYSGGFFIDDGTNGQDRENYTDDQDRESYS